MGVAAIVDWYGPFHSFVEFKAVANEYKRNDKLLYMATRKHNGINYIGLTISPKYRFSFHAKMQDKSNTGFFIGEIVSQGVSGKKPGKHPSDLKMAEIALINYTQAKFNKHHKKHKPKDCVVVYSRFFDSTDWETPVNPLPKFPQVIAFNSWSGEYS